MKSLKHIRSSSSKHVITIYNNLNEINPYSY